MSNQLILVTIISLLVLSSAFKKSSKIAISLQTPQLPSGLPGSSQIQQATNDVKSLNISSLQITNATQLNSTNGTISAALFNGTNDEGAPFTGDYLDISAENDGNYTNLEYLEVQSTDANGESFEAELINIELDDPQIEGNLTAINVTGVDQGKDFDVTYTDLQGEAEGELLNLEIAEVEGTNEEGEQFDVQVVSIKSVVDGQVSQNQAVGVSYPSKGSGGKKPLVHQLLDSDN